MNQDLLDGAYAGKSPMDVKFFGICVAACPVADSHICEYSKSGEPAPELYVDEFQDKGPCWYVPLKSSNIFLRCLPLEGVEKNSTVACKKPGGGYRNPATRKPTPRISGRMASQTRTVKPRKSEL